MNNHYHLCKECGEDVLAEDLDAQHGCCPHCGCSVGGVDETCLSPEISTLDRIVKRLDLSLAMDRLAIAA